MDEFTQPQSALLSRYDERTFRSLVEKRIILPSPATRNFGRGKLKTFTRDEVRIASILRQLDIGLTTFQQAGVTDWIRKHLSNVLRTAKKEKPPYIILETDIEGEGWIGTFRDAYDGRYISFMIEEGESERPLHRFMAANILQALWWDDEDIVAAVLSAPTQEAEVAPAQDTEATA
jgi:hypothetical protein